jgi:dTDP-glucose 4,6-dehydratase
VRLVVTGGAGFIGSHLVRSLLDGTLQAELGTLRPSEVVVLDRLTYAGNLANLDPVREDARLRVVVGDVCDREVLDEVLPAADAVLHLAAESHVDRSIEGAAAFVVTNVVGTQALLDGCLRHEVPTVVHVSTDEVYGSIDDGSWPETHPVDPSSPYSASKAGSDLLALAYARTHGMDVRVTRCSNNYGPYQYPEKVVPLFVTNLLDGLDVPLYGDGLNVRDWLHVHDHCRGLALVLAGGRPGEVYNIGGGTELTNRELAGRLLAACGAAPERIRPVADRKGHDRRYSVDCTKISRELGYAPSVPFEQGLADTVTWYREHEAWWRPLTSRPVAP